MKNINRNYRIFAFFMAFLMLASSVNLAIDMHYCQGQLKSMSFLGKAKNCHEMKAAMASCPHHQKAVKKTEGCSMSQKDCCSNKSIHIQADNDPLSITSMPVLPSSAQQFIIAFTTVFFKDVLFEKSIVNTPFYKPPILLRDISILQQVFRI